MPRTIVCQSCGIALNLPTDITPGKRLKCPKCAHRFVISEVDARSASTAPGLADASQTSLQDIPTNLPPAPDLEPTPRAEGNLRETFDLPMLGEADDPGFMPDPVSDKNVGDAAALFDVAEAPRRRKTAAEARSQARRCKSCQGFVPAGMSICQVCGLDQETGVRIDLEDDFGPKGPPPVPGPPLHIAIVGGICGFGGGVLLLISLMLSVKEELAAEKYGWLCLALVSGFSVFASYEFVRGKSVKLLMMALTLGVFIDLVAMIALPIFRAQFAETKQVRQERIQAGERAPEDDTDEEIEIRSTTELLDFDKIKLGLVFVGLYAIMSVYLMSPSVRKYVARKQLDLSPIPLS